jgi:2-polyprenyl-3-methyl-5-hydroxy-6-metoxy-1,4-benzoquinol methylase
MDIKDIGSIPVITVSYNTPDLVADLLSTFRQHYDNKIYIIDGSQDPYAGLTAGIAAQHKNVEFIHFNFNIHHGPGMAWAFTNLKLSGPVLVLDSDLSVLRGGFIETLVEALEPQMYGVGQLNYVNRGGFDVDKPEGALLYLHPALMLCNIDVLKQWPLPVKHGAPMIEAMTALHDAGKSDLLHHIEWVREDFSKTEAKNFIRHDWQGTVARTGGYHLEEWQRSVMQAQLEKLNPASTAPQNYNHDLVRMIPTNARGVVEVGCNNGALANVYKGINPSCKYTGIEIDKDNAERARAYCDTVLHLDIETVDESFFKDLSATSNVWIFGDVLEHLRNPWEVLARIRRSLPADGCVVVCLPNAQHWSVQAKLCVGDFRYEDSGLLDRTHMRFFTRATMLEMFDGAGFKIEEGFPRIFHQLQNDKVIAAIKMMAEGVGANPEQALQDSLPLQYVVKAVPK